MSQSPEEEVLGMELELERAENEGELKVSKLYELEYLHTNVSNVS